MGNEMDDEVLTPSEVAAELRVDRKTVVNWIKSGKLVGFRANTHWRTTRQAVDAFVVRPATLEKRERSREARAKESVAKTLALLDSL